MCKATHEDNTIEQIIYYANKYYRQIPEAECANAHGSVEALASSAVAASTKEEEKELQEELKKQNQREASRYAEQYPQEVNPFTGSWYGEESRGVFDGSKDRNTAIE